MKCLDCAINPLIHTFSGGASVSSRLFRWVCRKWRVFLKQQLILTMLRRPDNLKGVAGFKKQTELYPYKCRSKSPTTTTFTFYRLSNSNTYDLFKILVFVLTTRRPPVNSISWLFRWPRSCKKVIRSYYCWQLHIVFLSALRLHRELTKNNSSHSQLSYNLERNIVKWLTLTAKETETQGNWKANRNTQKKLSPSYHLIISIFSLFHFVASMKLLALISL